MNTEIKAGDLMIGNWVMIKGKFRQVVEITSSDTVQLSKHVFLWHYHVSKLTPVRLSPDLLEKCENYIRLTNKEFSIPVDDVRELILTRTGKYYQVRMHVYGTYIHLAYCDYLHQLQNLTKILGTELKIEL